MNQHAVDKAQALQCLVDILVEDQLVKPEYIQGLLGREQQSATYLGQGIAIPHGTPQSRQYILETGVRLAHFPEGVVWDGENKIYLAVVIAAKSDEHLQVLQILTRALLDDVSERVKNAELAQQIIELLQAQPPSLALHENLIATKVAVSDLDDFIWQASQLLKQQKMVECGFLSQLQPKNMIHLGEDLWSITASQHVLSPAVSIIQAEQAIQYQGQQLGTLLCIASNPQLDMTQFNRLMDIFFDPEQLQSLSQQKDAQHLAQLIGADVIPDWVSQRVVLANAHGLHARPATQLVNTCKAFQGEIQVSVDGGQFVSAKSLNQAVVTGM